MGRNKKGADSGHTTKPRKISTKSRGCQTKITGEIQPRKKVKDKDAPKKPTSAYLFFQKKRRVTLKEEEPDLSNVDQMSKMGKEWSNLSAEDKEPFEKLAAEDRVRYDNEMAEYKKKKGGEEKKGKKRAASKDGNTRESKKQKTETPDEDESAPLEEHDEEEGDDQGEGEGDEDEGAPENWDLGFMNEH